MYILLYVVVSGLFCNWVLINVWKRSENPHWQIQTENPIMFMCCITFGWFAAIPMFIAILLSLFVTGSLDETFILLAKNLDNNE